MLISIGNILQIRFEDRLWISLEVVERATPLAFTPHRVQKLTVYILFALSVTLNGTLRFDNVRFLKWGRNRSQFSFASAGSLANSRLIIIS